jgi:hypothetical protein
VKEAFRAYISLLMAKGEMVFCLGACERGTALGTPVFCTDFVLYGLLDSLFKMLTERLKVFTWLLVNVSFRFSFLNLFLLKTTISMVALHRYIYI